MPERQRNHWPALGLVLLYAGLILLPHILSYSQKEVAVFLIINVLLVVSYRLLTLTGEWSLAHVVIMGAGAYASALLSKRLGVPVPISMILGAGTAAVIAYLLSFPLLRMKGFYFLIGSFAAADEVADRCHDDVVATPAAGVVDSFTSADIVVASPAA